MSMLIKIYHRYREIISYLIAGIMTTIVSWGAYTVFVRILPLDSDNIRITIANCISWVIAVTFAYFVNKIWVFCSHNWKLSYLIKEFIKFVSSRVITGILEIIGVPLLLALGLNQKILGIDGMLSKVIVSVAVIILNYIFSKLMVFKN